jgi:hypothetical protein
LKRETGAIGIPFHCIIDPTVERFVTRIGLVPGRLANWILEHPSASPLILYLSLSLALTYPLIFRMTSALPGRGVDDPFLAWNLWWVKWSLLDLQSSPLFSNYIFYPIGINLSSYTLTLLDGVLSIPLQLAWSVILANNLIVIVAMVVAAYGAYLVVLDLLGRQSTAARAGAIIAGCIYGFASYRFSYLSQGGFNFNSNEWLPYYVLFLHRAFAGKAGAPRTGVMAGVFFVLASWSELTYAAFLGLVTALYLAFQLAVVRRRLFSKSVLFNIAALGLVSFVGLLPLLLALGADLVRYGDFLLRGSGGAEFLSADLLSFLIPSQYHPLMGFVSRGLSYHNMDFAFVGYVTLSLAIVGALARRMPNTFGFWAVAALIFASIMLGPVLHVANQPMFPSLLLPFRVLQAVPLLRANRLPVRYDHLLMLAVAILGGGGAFVVLQRARNHALLIVLLPALVLAEHLSVPLSLGELPVPAVYKTIAADPGNYSILDLPLSWRSSTFVLGRLDTKAQFYQSVHQKYLLGGNTSRYPPFKFQYFNELPIIHSLILLENGQMLDAGARNEDTKAAAEVVRFFDLRYVLLQAGTTGPIMLDYVQRVFLLTPLTGSTPPAFRVTAPASPSLTIDHAQAVSRMYFDEDWGRAQASTDGEAFRWATSARARIFVPLHSAEYQMCGLYAAARDGQSTRVWVNDIAIGEMTLSTAWNRQCINLPSRALRDGLNEIVFESNPVPLQDAVLAEDRRIGETGVAAPADLAVTSAGFFAGKFASLALNGREVYVTKRGYTLMAVDPQRAAPLAVQTFDTFRDEEGSARLAEFIRQLPAGTIVAGAVCDEASQHLTEEAFNALRSLGVKFDLRAHFRASHAFIGVKEAAPGSAVEESDSSFPANVSVGKNVTTPSVTFALGLMKFQEVQSGATPAIPAP